MGRRIALTDENVESPFGDNVYWRLADGHNAVGYRFVEVNRYAWMSPRFADGLTFLLPPAPHGSQ
jgi:hypothetical protein